MAASAPKLTLLIPGLLGPMPELAALPAAELPSLPGLRRLLSRGRRAAPPGPDPELTLFHLFDVRATGSDLPVAALTRVLDGSIPDDAWWLRVDPVHLQADIDRMLLTAHEELALSMEEAQAMAAELEAAFSEDDWRIEVGAPHRWYLQPGGEPRLETTPLRQVRGRDVGAALPRGVDARPWRTRLNEVQMLLHGSVVNAAREARGALPVNSLWFWGGGRMPQFGRCRWQGLWAREPLARALALHCGVATREPPADLARWLQQQPDPGEHLMVLEGLEAPLREHDVFAWMEALEQLERDWFAPLLKALRRGALQRLTLLDRASFEIDRPALWRVWRRPRGLPALLGR